MNVEDGAARQLTNACAEGGPAEKLIEPEKVAYQSTDGLTIHAYLYSPEDRSQKYPGLVYIHGGPTLQFFDDLQPNVQYFVQRGYVVLLPNVRGSTGYGKAFEEANDKDWGRGDLDDAIAGTEYMRGLSYVDPSNMGITGRSYGGILSMYAITNEPDAFQAAAPMSGYGDWPALRWEMELRHQKMQAHEFGPLEENEELWIELSSQNKIDRVTAPTFIVYGEGKDPWSDASRAFWFEMKRQYKTVLHKVYHNDGYYVDAPANVRQLLIDVADFFDFFLKGQGGCLACDQVQQPAGHVDGLGDVLALQVPLHVRLSESQLPGLVLSDIRRDGEAVADAAVDLHDERHELLRGEVVVPLRE